MTRDDYMSAFGYTDCAEEVCAAIDSIYDDFESRICENCKLWECGWCDSIRPQHRASMPTDKDFGCNKFVRKE